jgi:hypothetical protein
VVLPKPPPTARLLAFITEWPSLKQLVAASLASRSDDLNCYCHIVGGFGTLCATLVRRYGRLFGEWRPDGAADETDAGVNAGEVDGNSISFTRYRVGGTQQGAHEAHAAAAQEAEEDAEGVTMVALFLGKSGCYDAAVAMLEQLLARTQSNSSSSGRRSLAATGTARTRAKCLHALAEVISEREQGNGSWDEEQFLAAWRHLEGAVAIWRGELQLMGSRDSEGRVAAAGGAGGAAADGPGDDEVMATLAACLATQAYCGHCVRAVDLHDRYVFLVSLRLGVSVSMTHSRT